MGCAVRIPIQHAMGVLNNPMKGKQLVIFLCGGDKSRQKRDIARARKLKDEYDV